MRLIERLRSLNGDERPVWGKMTAEQMMSHLDQAGELPFGHSLADRSTFFSRTIVKPLILYLVSMPKEVKTSPDMNQQENGRVPQGFEADRSLVIELLDRIATTPTDYQCHIHPFFGKMSVKEWCHIIHKHIDHHLKQFGV